MAETTFADVLESPTGMDAALALAEEARLISGNLRGIRGEVSSPRAKQVLHPLHFQFWKMCERPQCQISGHVERRGYIIPGFADKSMHGAEIVREFAEATHGTPLPQYGVYSSYVNDVNDEGKSTYANLGAFTDHNPRMPFNEYTPMIDIDISSKDAIAPGVERAPGGLHEFPVKQLREYRFHHQPIVKMVRPDACAEPDYTCDWCGNTYPVRAHLTSHTQSVHPQMVQGQVQADAIKDAIAAPLTEIAKLTSDNSAVQNLLAQILNRWSEDATPEPPRRGRPPGSKNQVHDTSEEEN